MTLKIATIADLDLVKTMAEKFLEASGYKELGDLDTITNIATGILMEPGPNQVCILHSDQGMIAGIAKPFLYGKDRVATELAWWVNPEAREQGVGKELLEAFEYWAKEIANCKAITMVSLDDALGSYFVHNGYKLAERAYIKTWPQ